MSRLDWKLEGLHRCYPTSKDGEFTPYPSTMSVRIELDHPNGTGHVFTCLDYVSGKVAALPWLTARHGILTMTMIAKGHLEHPFRGNNLFGNHQA